MMAEKHSPFQYEQGAWKGKIGDDRACKAGIRHSLLVLLIFTIPVILLMLSGCSTDRRYELKDRAIVQAIGVDYHPETGRYQVSLQIFTPSSDSELSIVDPGMVNSTVLTLDGKSIAEALSQADKKHGKHVFYGHNKLLILGQEAAKSDIRGIIQYFNRDNQTRPNLDLVVAQGEANEILSAKVDDTILPAISVQRILARGMESGGSYRSQLVSVVNALESSSGSPQIPCMNLSYDQNENPQLEIIGTAVFRDGKMAGVLDEEETRGVLWLRGGVNDLMTLAESQFTGRTILQTDRVVSTVNVDVLGEEAVFTFRIQTESSIKEAELGDLSTLAQSDEKQQAISQLSDSQEEQIRQDVEDVLEKVIGDYESDVFNVYQFLRKYQPSYWKENGEEWQRVCKKIRWEIQVDSHINSDGYFR